MAAVGATSAKLRVPMIAVGRSGLVQCLATVSNDVVGVED